MDIKHILKLFLAATLLCLAACTRFDDINVSSFEVLSVTPTSLKSMDLKLKVTVNNPSVELRLSDMQALVYRGDMFIGRLDVEPLAISGHIESEYDVKGHISIDGGVPILQIMSMARDFSPEQYTADISAKVRLRSGLSKNLSMKKVNLSKFIKN